MQCQNKRPLYLNSEQLTDELMYKIFNGLHLYLESLRHNTDEMRKEIKKLKEKMK